MHEIYKIECNEKRLDVSRFLNLYSEQIIIFELIWTAKSNILYSILDGTTSHSEEYKKKIKFSKFANDALYTVIWFEILNIMVKKKQRHTFF